MKIDVVARETLERLSAVEWRGLLGRVLDESFNVRDGRNPTNHEYFVSNNPQVCPNALVLQVMRETLAERNGAKGI